MRTYPLQSFTSPFAEIVVAAVFIDGLLVVLDFSLKTKIETRIITVNSRIRTNMLTVTSFVYRLADDLEEWIDFLCLN